MIIFFWQKNMRSHSEVLNLKADYILKDFYNLCACDQSIKLFTILFFLTLKIIPQYRGSFWNILGISSAFSVVSHR